jgi:hypothetical protein
VWSVDRYAPGLAVRMCKYWTDGASARDGARVHDVEGHWTVVRGGCPGLAIIHLLLQHITHTHTHTHTHTNASSDTPLTPTPTEDMCDVHHLVYLKQQSIHHAIQVMSTHNTTFGDLCDLDERTTHS